ncbi:MAG: class I SAM-dependent RNA methyltransferase [Oscillospiraceae bacterium]|nr:class I SAM-dependent RNA methyltransferase [Oscillospiraceae bacterium]
MSEQLRLSAPVVMGVEGLCADELRRAGFADVTAEDGRVFFAGDLTEAARANLWLRTAERVQILLGRFPAGSFEELFEGVRALPLEALIPADGAFPVKGHSVKSRLVSVPDCQRIIKKAAAVRLGGVYGRNELPETGARYQLHFTLIRDVCSLYLDTSGEPLHKRGYRAESTLAPISETLAAAMVMMSRRRGDRPMIDPMCGSGTIAVEAALMAGNRAPGLARRFALERFAGFDRAAFARLKTEARESETAFEGEIFASDVDPEAAELARSNAEKAGVGDRILVSVGDLRQVRYPDSGVVITNPPYGERIGDRDESRRLFAFLGRVTAARELGAVIISPDTELEKAFGRKADKKRKIYNGMIRCDLYCFRPNRLLKKA